MLSDEEIEEIVRSGDFTNLVAVADEKPGCPEKRWDGPYTFRCDLGINKCSIHGNFPVKYRVKK